MVTETVHACGHEFVSGTHQSTFEVTTDSYLTPAGDCIIGVGADRAPVDFSDSFRDACQSRSATITARIRVDDHSDVITGTGHPDLSFSSDRSLIGRTSEFVDDRTVMVNADGASEAIDRDVIALLVEGRPVTITLDVE